MAKRESVPLMAYWTALRLASRAGFKLWSPEARTLADMIVSAAGHSPEAIGVKLTKEHVLLGARQLAESKKARERMAQALGIMAVDAWLLQESLKREVGSSQGGEPPN